MKKRTYARLLPINAMRKTLTLTTVKPSLPTN